MSNNGNQTVQMKYRNSFVSMERLIDDFFDTEIKPVMEQVKNAPPPTIDKSGRITGKSVNKEYWSVSKPIDSSELAGPSAYIPTDYKIRLKADGLLGMTKEKVENDLSVRVRVEILANKYRETLIKELGGGDLEKGRSKYDEICKKTGGEHFDLALEYINTRLTEKELEFVSEDFKPKGFGDKTVKTFAATSGAVDLSDFEKYLLKKETVGKGEDAATITGRALGAAPWIALCFVPGGASITATRVGTQLAVVGAAEIANVFIDKIPEGKTSTELLTESVYGKSKKDVFGDICKSAAADKNDIKNNALANEIKKEIAKVPKANSNITNLWWKDGECYMKHKNYGTVKLNFSDNQLDDIKRNPSRFIYHVNTLSVTYEKNKVREFEEKQTTYTKEKVNSRIEKYEIQPDKKNEGKYVMMVQFKADDGVHKNYLQLSEAEKKLVDKGDWEEAKLANKSLDSWDHKKGLSSRLSYVHVTGKRMYAVLDGNKGVSVGLSSAELQNIKSKPSSGLYKVAEAHIKDFEKIYPDRQAGKASPKQDNPKEENNIAPDTVTLNTDNTQPDTTISNSDTPQRTNSKGWGDLNFGGTSFGQVIKNLGYVMATLPDTIFGVLTGRHKMGTGSILSLLSMGVGSFFVKNPILKALMVGGGAVSLLNKAGKSVLSAHEEIDKTAALAQGSTPTAISAQRSTGTYVRYADEPLNSRIVNPELKGNTICAIIDGKPSTMVLTSNVVAAYNEGSLPLNVIVNRILAANDAKIANEQRASEAYDATRQQTETQGQGLKIS